MALIPRDIVDAVRERTDIVEVVRRHIKLDRKGQSWVGLCPFHNEKTPSFNVIPSKGIYHCFGCQAGGDVFRFVMHMENVSFVGAVQQLAGPAGITIETRELTEDERRKFRARATLLDLMEEAGQFYEAQLWTGPEGAAARAYLERRRIAEAFARKYRLGWAPGGWTRLTEHLQRKGFSLDLIVNGGLARRREQGDGAYDTFRERVIIPIRDDRSRVIAFGGRLLQGDGPKYINSPESELYKKGEVLYGLDAAQSGVRARERILLVEGYFDVLSLHQAGFTEAVATCGTALSDHHADRLARLTHDITFLTDSDRAGDSAAERVEEKYLAMFTARKVAAWRLNLPDAKDPDEIIRERGPEAMEAALRAREPLLTWYARRQLQRFGYSTEARRRILDDSTAVLAGLPEIDQTTFAALTRIPQEEVFDAVTRRRRGEREPSAHEDASDAWRPSREVVHLLWLLVHRYEQVADLLPYIDPRVLEEQTEIVPIISRLAEGEPLVRILDELPEGGVSRTLRAVGARATLYGPDEAPWGLLGVLSTLLVPRFDRWSSTAAADGTAAMKRGDTAAGMALISDVQRGRKLRTTLDAALKRQDVDGVVGAMRELMALTTGKP